MEPILFDTSIWINYFRGVVSHETDLLANYLLNDIDIVICPVIIQEILQGIGDDTSISAS